MKCSNNLKQMGLGLHSYHDANTTFPKCPNIVNPTTGDTEEGIGWNAFILPYIEQDALWRTMNPNLTAYRTVGNANRQAGQYKIATFLCPSYNEVLSSKPVDNVTVNGANQNAYTTHYAGNAGPDGPNLTTGTAYPANGTAPARLACSGILPYHPSLSTTNPTQPGTVTISAISDGTSNTLMVFEVAWSGLARPWRIDRGFAGRVGKRVRPRPRTSRTLSTPCRILAATSTTLAWGATTAAVATSYSATAAFAFSATISI